MVKTELIIVGGGVAGLTAGLYAARARLDTVVLERLGTGGQMVNAGTVENFPGFPGGVRGYDLAPLIAEQAMAAGVRIEYAEARTVRREAATFVVATDGEDFRARAVIVAAGSTLARLGVPGEAELTGRGVSSCAVCDGEFFRDEHVVVVGGGDSAFDEALELAGVAARVTIVHRRAEPRAARVLVERAREHPKIAFRWNTTVQAIEGGETVEAVRLRGLDGTSERLAAAGVFVYVGLRPNSALVEGLVATDAAGHIPVDPWLRTAVPGLLAAGDIRQHSARQFITSAGDGATAALAAERFLRRGEWPHGD